MTDDVRVLIKGADRDGIPLDVFGALTGAIGVLYPNARMGPGEGFGSGNGVTLIISPEDRRNTTKGRKRAIAAKRQDHDPDEPQSSVTGWDGESLSTIPPRELSEWLCAVGGALLINLEGAANYVEQEAHTEDGRRFAMTLQWQTGKTPHQKRAEAEAKLAAVLALHEKCYQSASDETHDTNPVCTCGNSWPCETAEAASRD